MGNLIDLTNQIFGDYKVTGFDNSKGKGKYYWKVKCIYCGNEKSIASSSLKRNLGTSCCSKKQKTNCTEQNLKICKKTKNAINCKIYKNNKSGYKGIFWNKRLNKWEVGIQYDKKNHYLGVYSNLEDAIKIRKDAEKKYFGKFLRKEGDLNNGLG